MENNRDRSKKLKVNTVSSLAFQICTIVCGFILPKLIITKFGSEINGLIGSISQFLAVISFLELGVGTVVQSSLYKPLADKDEKKISKIVASAQKFFSKLSRILLAYVIILMAVYPFIAKQNFGYLYTATLILVMSISLFAQYYFGIVNRLLLTADQRGYVSYNVQTVTLILNTIATCALIKNGTSIHFVKLTTSLIYIMRPVALLLYVKKHYNIDRRISYKGEPIEQKWNGVSQHVAAVILDGTDPIVLTVFMNLSAVSIYSVYYIVVYGVKQLFLSLSNGIQSLTGELWARQELVTLKKAFSWTEWVIHTGTTFVFGVTAIMVLPFVRIYTFGIHDADYIQPLFAVLITAANGGHCLRLPYSIMILAGGHYKQTQHSYIIAATLNIVISVLTVRIWGLIGVAIGTLVAMTYQTVWMAFYVSKNLIMWPIKNFFKQLFADVVTVYLMYFLTKFLVLSELNYSSWIVLALKVSIISGGVVIIVNYLLYPVKIDELLKRIARSKTF